MCDFFTVPEEQNIVQMWRFREMGEGTHVRMMRLRMLLSGINSNFEHTI